MPAFYTHLGPSDLAVLDYESVYNEYTNQRLGYQINRINVPPKYRGHGHARELLKKLVDKADQERADLYLEIYPSGGLDYQQLLAWYQRNGFRYAKGWYRRVPRESNA